MKETDGFYIFSINSLGLLVRRYFPLCPLLDAQFDSTWIFRSDKKGKFALGTPADIVEKPLFVFRRNSNWIVEWILWKLLYIADVFFLFSFSFLFNLLAVQDEHRTTCVYLKMPSLSHIWQTSINWKQESYLTGCINEESPRSDLYNKNWYKFWMFKFFKFNNTRLEVPTDRSNFCLRILQYFNIHTLCIPQSLWRGLPGSGIGEQDPRRYTEMPTVFFLWNERTTGRNDSPQSIVYYHRDFSRPTG